MQKASKPATKKTKSRQKQAKPRATMKASQPRAPVSMGTVGNVPQPRFRTGKNGRITVTHSELIGDIVGSTEFTATQYAMNPGLVNFLAWLSVMAPNYESYQVKSLKFRYLPMCSTTQVGMLYLSADFDPADASPVSEKQLSSYEGTRMGSAWTRHEYSCAQHNLRKRSSYFVRNGPLNANQDVALYDIGNFIVATTGNAGTPPLGKLWADYTIELITPQMNNPAIGNSLSGKFTGADDFASNPTTVGNFPLTATAAAGVLTITASQPYQCLLSLVLSGSTISAATAGGTATSAQRYNAASASGASLGAVWTVSFLPGQTFTLDSTATSIAAWNVRAGQYNVANA